MQLTDGRYFKTRKIDGSDDFEEGYWGEIVDPDGVVRDRLNERDRFVEDAAPEIEYLEQCAPGRILDVGCGPGYLLSALSSQWEKWGVELSEVACEHASRWASVFHGHLRDAEFSDGFFDVVVMYHVIEHMTDPIKELTEVRRVLRGGGTLLVATPDFDSGCARRFGANYRLLQDQTHVSLFTSESMHRLLRTQGFVIDRVEFPFFDTRYFTAENLTRLFDVDQVSPPFYGNLMVFHGRKPHCFHSMTLCQRAGVCGAAEVQALEHELQEITVKLAGKLRSDCPIRIWIGDQDVEYGRYLCRLVHESVQGFSEGGDDQIELLKASPGGATSGPDEDGVSLLLPGLESCPPSWPRSSCEMVISVVAEDSDQESWRHLGHVIPLPVPAGGSFPEIQASLVRALIADAREMGIKDEEPDSNRSRWPSTPDVSGPSE